MWFLTQRQALVRCYFFGTFVSLLKLPKKDSATSSQSLLRFGSLAGVATFLPTFEGKMSNSPDLAHSEHTRLIVPVDHWCDESNGIGVGGF